ncbi:hypothetical protein, partial [Pseudonocardia zijingensis]
TLARVRVVPGVAGSLARLRRGLAGVAVALGAAVVVAALGVVADGAAAVRTGEAAVSAPPGTIVVTVGAERTPWEVAQRIAPGAPGERLAGLAEQIVTDNSLGPVPLRPGQVLRVTSG